jgi:hypothetical protein
MKNKPQRNKNYFLLAVLLVFCATIYAITVMKMGERLGSF